MIDLSAETAVLAVAFQGNEGYHEVADLVDARCFYETTNGLWWKVFQEYYGKHPDGRLDIPTTKSIVNSLNLSELNDPKELQFINVLANSVVELGNGRRAAAKLRKLTVARDVSSILREGADKVLETTGEEPLFEIISRVEKPLQDYIGTLSSGKDPERFGVGIREWCAHKVSNPGAPIGISTGWPSTDKAWGGGMRRKSVNVVASRMKGGKSSIALNMGCHVAGILDIPVLYLDTEMGKDQHWARMMAALSENTIDVIETGAYGSFPKNSPELQRCRDAMVQIEQMPFYYQSISGQPFEETLSLMKRWVKKEVGTDSNGVTKDCLIIFDYIKLMDEGGLSKLPEYQALGFLMTGLHNFAVQADIPMLAFAQINRDGIDEESSRVIAGSDRIGWLCTSLSIWKEKSKDEKSETEGNQKLVVTDTRFGAGTPYPSYINFNFKREMGLIRELGLSTATNRGESFSDPEF